MKFDETVHAYLAAKYYEKLTAAFGRRGELAFLHATRYYAMQRGRRMAQRAIRDGQELTQESYNYYGEWVNTEGIRARGLANQMEQGTDGTLKITVCPWHFAFKELGAREAGALYCSDLDASISRGFNPELGYTVKQTLHTADCCIHALLSGDICAGSGRGKNPDGLRSFEYHCAHLYWAYYEVCAAIFQSEGEKVNQEVLECIRQEYGKEAADRLWSYRYTNFNVCDSGEPLKK